jgi:regulation of enolase protein 1 (concanavalin A-like superfamily)
MVTMTAAANTAGARSATVTIADQTFTVSESAAPCSYGISPASPSLAADGGAATVTVTAGSWCSWTATVSDPSWLTITSGAPGTGNGTVTLTAPPNPAGARSTPVMIAGQTLLAYQAAAACTFSISPASQPLANGGDGGTIAVTTDSWCSWTATSSDPSWLTVTGGASGAGSGTIAIAASANPAGPRMATVTIGDQTFTASQAAAPCSYAISPPSQPLGAAGGAGSVAITTASWCGWSAASNAPSWLTFAGPASGVGSGTVAFNAGANGGPARTGTITIAGLTFTVSQPAPALPGGWSNQDVGATGKAGSAAFDWSSTTFTLKGGGADIWGTADAFHYAYRQLWGDGVIVARVASVSSTNAWVKAGVMIRETLDPGSAQALMLVSASRGSAFQRRETTGGTSVSTSGPLVTAPYWIKLERIGDTFNAYSSPDGATWALQGTDTIPMATTVYVGLAVSSHVSGALATAAFDNVSVP